MKPNQTKPYHRSAELFSGLCHFTRYYYPTIHFHCKPKHLNYKHIHACMCLCHSFHFWLPNASRPLLRCRPRAQYEVHELPLFVEKSRSCRVVQERALVQHEQVASKKNSLHEHTRALYVIATRRLFYDELNAMSLRWRCDENQLNIFSIDLFSSAASFTVARSRLWCRIV